MSNAALIAATLIAIDWGTTNRRGYLLGKDGEILDRREDDLGIVAAGATGFGATFGTFTAPWREAADIALPVLMSGMIGSRQGWVEAPYALCPARAEDIAAQIMPLPGIDSTWIVPGICLNGDRRDVMRGEEVQIFGALGLASLATATLCLPGTHSKWARVEDGRLVDFATAMTGEVYQVMRTHSILGALMEGNAGHESDAFRRGLDAAAAAGGLLHHLFSVRADGLFGVTRADEQASYLSGLLIGHELRDLGGAFRATDEPVLLVGAAGLTRIYEEALDHLALPFRTVEGHAATVRGLFAVWAANPLARLAG